MSGASAAATATATATPLTVLVTGANRGIGLGLVELYAKQPHVHVIGTARDLKTATKLSELAKAHKNVSAVALDVSDSKSIAALPAALAALQPAVKALDVVINNAGVLSGVKGHDGYSPLHLETADNLSAVFRTNVIGAWEVTAKVLPLLRAAASKRPQIINVSSVAGSFDFALNGVLPTGGLAYRVSKTALNQLSALQSREYNLPTVTAQTAAAAAPGDAKLAAAAAAADPVIGVVALHPGLIDTDILKQQQTFELPPALFRSTADSAAGIDKVIRDAAAAPPNPKVKFLDALTGAELPW